MGISDQPYEEKRDFIRMKIDAPLQARLTADGGTHVGTCTELSGGGMQVILDTALEEGSEWEADVSSEHGHSPQLRAIVKVVRVKPDGDNYALGLQITDVIS